VKRKLTTYGLGTNDSDHKLTSKHSKFSNNQRETKLLSYIKPESDHKLAFTSTNPNCSNYTTQSFNIFGKLSRKFLANNIRISKKIKIIFVS